MPVLPGMGRGRGYTGGHGGTRGTARFGIRGRGDVGPCRVQEGGGEAAGSRQLWDTERGTARDPHGCVGRGGTGGPPGTGRGDLPSPPSQGPEAFRQRGRRGPREAVSAAPSPAAPGRTGHNKALPGAPLRVRAQSSRRRLRRGAPRPGGSPSFPAGRGAMTSPRWRRRDGGAAPRVPGRRGSEPGSAGPRGGSGAGAARWGWRRRWRWGWGWRPRGRSWRSGAAGERLPAPSARTPPRPRCPPAPPGPAPRRTASGAPTARTSTSA